jgi:hypothetical protein
MITESRYLTRTVPSSIVGELFSMPVANMNISAMALLKTSRSPEEEWATSSSVHREQ